MAATRHTHKFRRHKYKSGNIIYFCVLDCTVKMAPALAIGKKSLCNICGEPFTMTDYSVRLAKPHCDKCHKPKDKMMIKDEVATAAINRAIEVIDNTTNDGIKIPLSLSERLARTINHVNTIDEDEDEL
jgi:hypothetical protein